MHYRITQGTKNNGLRTKKKKENSPQGSNENIMKIAYKQQVHLEFGMIFTVIF